MFYLSGLFFRATLIISCGEQFSIDFLPLFMFCTSPKFGRLFSPALFFYSEIFFYIKYFVLSYAKDVVSTLSVRMRRHDDRRLFDPIRIKNDRVNDQ